MRIIHVLDDYSNKTGHSTIYMIEGMKKLGHHIEVYTSNVQLSPFKGDDSKSLVPIKRFRGIKVFKKAFFPGVIFKILFSKNPDFYHTHVMGYFSTFLTGYLKYFKRYKLALFADIDRDVPPHSGLFGRIYYNFFMKWPTKNVNLIHVFTEEQKRILMERANIKGEKIFVWPSGVDLSKFERKQSKEELRKKLRLPNKFIILNVSSVVRKRRIELILNSIKNLDVYFVHVGIVVDDEYFEYLQNIVKENDIGDKVLFVGRRIFDETIDYYLAADLFVLASSNESFGIPLLEAISAGLPILATDVGAAKDLIDEGVNGFIVEENNIEDKLSLAMKLDFEKAAIHSKEKAKNYDWDVLIPKLEKMYLSIK